MTGRHTAMRILHLEDDPRDAELVKALLEAEGFTGEIVRARDRADFAAAFESGGFDAVLSDYSLPDFDGLAALEWVREKDPVIPFLLLSGTIGEEAAIESLRKGATDYILKERLSKLPSALERALREARERAERRRAEEQIREQAALLDVDPDAIVVVDLEERVRFWNLGAQRMYGWPAAEATGRALAELGYRKAVPSLAEVRRLLLEQGEWTGEQHFTARDGRAVTVESRWRWVAGSHGQPKAILIISSDVSEKKVLEAQFLRAQRLESIGTLAGGIAHDLNNVLAPVLMAVQILRAKLTSPDDVELLDMLESSVKRGAGLVKQILSFARGVQGQRTPVQLRHIILDMLKVARDTFPPSIRIRNDVAADLWPVAGDPTQLYQVLMNLCVNSRDAMPGGGALEIEAENLVLDEHFARHKIEARPGPYVVLTVRDTGSGISPETIDKIFDPFFSTKEPGQGTGLGLSTSLGIVRSHGGFIDVASEVNRGTTFKVYLPAANLDDAVAREALPRDLPMGSGELILVVDDEPSVRELTRKALETRGYRILTAADGTEAVALYAQRQSEIRLVLTDLAMPFMDGPATIRALRRLDPQTKIVIFSGLMDPKGIEELAEPGRTWFLQKPFTTHKLVEVISGALGGNPTGI